MDYYLRELDRALSRYGVANKEEILDKYRKRYMFGVESGLTEYEIEQMLGEPEDVARKLSGKASTIKEDFKGSKIDADELFKEDGISDNFNDEESSFEEEQYDTKENNYDNEKLRNLTITTGADDIEIIHANVNVINSKFVGSSPDNYFIKDNKDEVSITLKKRAFGFFSRKGGKIILTIPSTMQFARVKISTASGDVVVDDFGCNSFDLEVVSGDVKFSNIHSTFTKLVSVTGNVKGNFVDSNSVRIQTVSGKFLITAIKGYDLNCETISGDIEIKKTNCLVKNSRIAGDIKIGKGDF